jgi:hypothetical protein
LHKNTAKEEEEEEAELTLEFLRVAEDLSLQKKRSISPFQT